MIMFLVNLLRSPLFSVSLYMWETFSVASESMAYKS